MTAGAISRGVTRSIALLSAAATLAVALWAFQPADKGLVEWIGFAVFGGWALLPYLTLAWVGAQGGTPWRDAILVTGVGLICAATLLLYYLAFFAEPDAQSALVLVFLPAYQHVAALAVWAASRLAPGA